MIAANIISFMNTKQFIIIGLFAGVFMFIQGCVAPADFPSANWCGTWSSDQCPFVNGVVYAELPDPLPAEGEFEADVQIQYSIFSVYRPGKKLRLKMAGSLTYAGTSGKNDKPLVVNDGNMPYILKIMSKSDGSSSGQQIDFQAAPNLDRTKFDGKYTSVNPSDAGTFVIYKM